MSKRAANVVAACLVAPLAALSGLEARARPGHESLFALGTQLLAMLPGLPGAYLRRAFYRQTLDACSLECHIGFGAVVTHRETVIEPGVYIGSYALVGSARLREGTSIGSRASLLSGTNLHEFLDGRWTPYDHRQLRQISIGPHTLVGEGAILMADVGSSAMVAAGAVVGHVVPDGIAVAGNPARFVRRLDLPPTNDSAVGA